MGIRNCSGSRKNTFLFTFKNILSHHKLSIHRYLHNSGLIFPFGIAIRYLCIFGLTQLNMIRVGIFFGGPSREREISFAGGRTVYDNLDKSIFEPVLLFIDAGKKLIQLDWPYIYKGTIRDFYPPAKFIPRTKHHFQVYSESLSTLNEKEIEGMHSEVGQTIEWEALPGLIDFAFLALHGEFGEDGQIQGLLQSLNIPWSGSGIRASAIGMDKAFQKKLMKAGGFPGPAVEVINKADWKTKKSNTIWQQTLQTIGLPMVVRPSNQGSSIGVRILGKETSEADFKNAVDSAFFIHRLSGKDWLQWSESERVDYLRHLSDLREGLGFPMDIHIGTHHQVVHNPDELLLLLDAKLLQPLATALLESHWTEQSVVVEGFIEGKEFSCIVIRNLDGKAIALPPTEIIKKGHVFDYRSKYLPGMARKETPIALPEADIQKIRNECARLFEYFQFNTYARIDGFISESGTVILNDPNTTSGMLPSSFFFHQAAEIGLDPSRFLTYIIYTSIQERLDEHLFAPPWRSLKERLSKLIEGKREKAGSRKKIGVLLGGYSFERHISVESGRNIYEKLSSSDKYDPIPIFLYGKAGDWKMAIIPMNFLLKDNADDIRHKIEHFEVHPVVQEIREQCAGITRKFASPNIVFEPQHVSIEDLTQQLDAVFIALHGRPGEDGEIQRILQEAGIPYNGSDSESSAITINKYETLCRLKEAGFTVAEQLLVSKKGYLANPDRVLTEVTGQIGMPLVAKPVDDGCSSAVKIIRSRSQLATYLNLIFRDEALLTNEEEHLLSIKAGEEFPQKSEVLIESLIDAQGATTFMEVTVGLRTYYEHGKLHYQIFEPSEALATGEVLTLEEKFLAGEGQNITPARFSSDESTYRQIAQQVKGTIESAARLLGVHGYARVDAFVRIFDSGETETIIIEVNSLPGMTPATCIFHQAAIEGLKPYDFIDQIVEFGLYEHSNTNFSR